MRQQTSLENLRILTAGGGTGIVRAAVALLAQQGARVLTFGRHQAGLDEALSHGQEGPGSAEGLTADVGTREGVKRIFAELDEKLGGIDILASCAALGAQPKLVIFMAGALALSACNSSNQQAGGTSGNEVANRIDRAADQSGPAAKQVLQSYAAEARTYPTMVPLEQARSFTQKAIQKAGRAEADAKPESGR